jgi:hypothetical protein
MPSESDRSPSGRPATLDEAIDRIEELEERLARLESVLSLNDDGSVDIRSDGQLRVVATNHMLLEAGAHSFEMNIVGAELKSAGPLKLDGSEVRLQAGLVNGSTAMTQFSGVVRCDTLITNNVVASSYTPGAGNLM